MFNFISTATASISKFFADRRDDRIAQQMADDQYEQYLDRLREAEMAQTDAMVERHHNTDLANLN